MQINKIVIEDNTSNPIHPQTSVDMVIANTGYKLSDACVFPCTLSLTGTTYTATPLMDLPSDNVGDFMLWFRAPKDYAAGETIKVGAINYTAKNVAGEALKAGAFKAEAIVVMGFNKTAATCYLAAGGSGSGSISPDQKIVVGGSQLPNEKQCRNIFYVPEGNSAPATANGDMVVYYKP